MNRIVCLLLITLVFSSCKKEKTIWETDWSTPLINDTLSLDKLVNDSTLTESGGYYLLDLDRTLFDLNITELIAIPDTTISEPFVPSLTVNISPGFSFVNSVEEHLLNIPDVQLRTIILREGFIDVRVENPLPTITFFDVQLPGVTKNGVTFSHQYQAPPMVGGVPGVVNQSINISGYQIDLTGVSGGDINILRSQITVSTDPAGPDVTLSTSDITKVDATFRDIKVNYARGYFGSKIVSDTTIINLDALNAVSSGLIDLPSSVIQFHILNGLKVNAQAKMTVVSNENSSGNVVDLSGYNIGANFSINPATGAWSTLVPSYKLIEFNALNSNIEPYLENLGKKHTVGYQMQLNPWGNVSGSNDEIFPQSKLNVRMTATMPINIGMDNLLLKDTFAITLNQDAQKTRIKSGELVLNTSNAFPISGEIKIHFLDENKVVLNTVVGSQILASSLNGTVNANYGFNVNDSELQFILTEAVLNTIDNVKFLIVETKFNTINPVTGLVEPQSIPFGAFLAIQLKAKLKTENKF